MAEVKGRMIATVSIDASAEELILALAKEFGVAEIFMERMDEYYQIIDAAGEGGKPYLIHMVNRAYHGSPNFCEESRKALTENQYRCAMHLMELEKLSKKI